MATPYMMDMKDFSAGQSGPEITGLVAGKTIESVEIDECGLGNMLIINFADCSRIFLRYEWIYGWKFFDRVAPALAPPGDPTNAA